MRSILEDIALWHYSDEDKVEISAEPSVFFIDKIAVDGLGGEMAKRVKEGLEARTRDSLINNPIPDKYPEAA